MAKRTETPATTQGTGPREVVPEFFSKDNGEGVATIQPSPPFIFAHHRKRWMVIDGRVVPELTKIPLVSGSNRVLVAPDGRVRFADTQAMLQDRQFRLVPHNKAPNGRSYLREVDTMVDGRIVNAVISSWDTAHAGEEHVSFDAAGYADWLEKLVADGDIAPITPHRAREKLEAVRALLSKAMIKVGQNKGVSTERIDALRAEVVAWEKVTKADAPKGAKVAARITDVDLSGGAE